MFTQASGLQNIMQSSEIALKRAKHFQILFGTLITFALIQSCASYLGAIRDFQYYVRILYLIEINIILTASLGLINGFTGQFSIGHAGFMAIGAYTSVTITTILPRLFGINPVSVSTISGHLIFVFSLVCAGLLAGLSGVLIGIPSLRLKGDYLAIVTLAAGEVIRALLRFFDFVGGPRGVTGIPKFSSGAYIGFFLLISLWIMRNFVFSHYGRSCVAVRDNEIAAAAVGINTTMQKVIAFVLGAFFAGIAGSLFAHLSQYINPDNFSIFKSLEVLMFLYIGGASSLSGAMIGAGIFTIVPEFLRLANIESLRMVIYPLILIIVMRFKQDGIMGNKELPFMVPWKYLHIAFERQFRIVSNAK